MVIIVTLRENKTYNVERKLGVTVSAAPLQWRRHGDSAATCGVVRDLFLRTVGREGRGRGIFENANLE